jgi:Spy/CpxP family protein refolding chaperone
MRRLVLTAMLAGLLVSAPLAVFAQAPTAPTAPNDAGAPNTGAPTTPGGPGQGQGQRPHRHHKGLLRQLGLTPEQWQQIREIRQTQPKGKARRQAVLAVLTPQQRQQLKQMRHAHRGQGRLRGQRQNAQPGQNENQTFPLRQSDQQLEQQFQRRPQQPGTTE